jgi:hypothetical protein
MGRQGESLMWEKEAAELVEGCIDAWMEDPDLRCPARQLEQDKERLILTVSELLSQKGVGIARRYDQARSFLVRQLPSPSGLRLDLEQFVLFKQHGAVEFILESAFGSDHGVEKDKIVLPRQREALLILSRCIHPLRDKDVITFICLFSGSTESSDIDHEKTMRYRSMVWFIYLIFDMFRVAPECMCRKDTSCFKAKLSLLLGKTLQGEINGEKGDYEAGRWSDTLFSWMQGEENRTLVEKLVRQFNFENRVEHGNRMLLARHRECMYKTATALLCK